MAESREQTNHLDWALEELRKGSFMDANMKPDEIVNLIRPALMEATEALLSKVNGVEPDMINALKTIKALWISYTMMQIVRDEVFDRQMAAQRRG